MNVVKSYPRQHHTLITIVDYLGNDRVFNGRLTEVVLYSNGAGLLAEVNMFADHTTEEPAHHEFIVCFGIRVTAVEERMPEPAPPMKDLYDDATPTELPAGYDDAAGGEE